MIDAKNPQKNFPFMAKSAFSDPAIGVKHVCHLVGMVAASNKDEAYGKAVRLSEKAYARSKGFCEHFVVVGIDEVLDPDQEYEFDKATMKLDMIKP